MCVHTVELKLITMVAAGTGLSCCADAKNVVVVGLTTVGEAITPTPQVHLPLREMSTILEEIRMMSSSIDIIGVGVRANAGFSPRTFFALP
jgi:hypothetical protein